MIEKNKQFDECDKRFKAIMTNFQDYV